MSHSHTDDYKIGQKNAWFGIICNVLLFVVKLFAGIFGRSQAMIADAVHTASDALTSVAVLVGFKIASKPADEHHPFGHGRAESIVAKIISLVLIGVGLGIAFTSAKILISGEMRTPGNIALIVAGVSVIVKEIAYRKVIKAGKELDSASLKNDAYHHRSDAASSLAALVGILGARLGKTFMDPLAGIVVGAFIIKMGVDAFHRAYDELMDAAPPEELTNEIKRVTSGVEGVETVKRIMVRKAGIDLYPEVIIGVLGDKTVEEGHLVTVKVKQALFREVKRIKSIIVHVEPTDITD